MLELVAKSARFIRRSVNFLDSRCDVGEGGKMASFLQVFHGDLPTEVRLSSKKRLIL